MSCKIYSIEYNDHTNDEFRERWDNYKDKTQKILRGKEHKQTACYAHFQTAGYSGLINDIEMRFIDNTNASDPTRSQDF